MRAAIANASCKLGLGNRSAVTVYYVCEARNVLCKLNLSAFQTCGPSDFTFELPKSCTIGRRTPTERLLMRERTGLSKFF